jgi:hypothetical protein
MQKSAVGHQEQHHSWGCTGGAAGDGVPRCRVMPCGRCGVYVRWTLLNVGVVLILICADTPLGLTCVKVTRRHGVRPIGRGWPGPGCKVEGRQSCSEQRQIIVVIKEVRRVSHGFWRHARGDLGGRLSRKTPGCDFVVPKNIGTGPRHFEQGGRSQMVIIACASVTRRTGGGVGLTRACCLCVGRRHALLVVGHLEEQLLNKHECS